MKCISVCLQKVTTKNEIIAKRTPEKNWAALSIIFNCLDMWYFFFAKDW